jgi:peptidyl-prolyl cis-trans isomerase A (cyclophilin A)
MKLKNALLLPALAAVFAAATYAQNASKPDEALPDAPTATAAAMTHPNGPTVVMDTSMGRITCQFFQQQAPKTVANFIALAQGTKDWTDPNTNKVQHNKPLYDGTIFHRVIPEFMIQGGDPTGTGMGNPGYRFNDEFDPNLNFDQPGRLAMANSGPNTNGSQFFITEQAYDSLNQHYNLFGQCDAASIEVVKAIARVKTDSNDKPVAPVILMKVTIVQEGQPAPAKPGAISEEAPAGNATSNPDRHLQRLPDVEVNEAQEHIITKQSPVYPEEAKKDHISGVVTVAILIGPDGAVKVARATEGPEALRAAAEQAVRAWRYKPFFVQGQPGTVQTKTTVAFNLN